MKDLDKLINRFALLIIGIVIFIVMFVPAVIVIKFFVGLLIADFILDIIIKKEE